MKAAIECQHDASTHVIKRLLRVDSVWNELVHGGDDGSPIRTAVRVGSLEVTRSIGASMLTNRRNAKHYDVQALDELLSVPGMWNRVIVWAPAAVKVILFGAT